LSTSAGNHESKPIYPDRLAAKVSHIRIEGLAAGQGEEDRTQHDEGHPAIGVTEKRDGIAWIQRFQDLRIFEQIPSACRAQQDEPKRDDWSEEAPNARASPALDHEEPNQNGGSQRNDVRFQKRSDDFHALDRAQDRNGRRDHRVTKKQ
jgi:hypothetical protein